MVKINVENKSFEVVVKMRKYIMERGGRILHNTTPKELCFEMHGIPLKEKPDFLREVSQIN